ncbi:hypothetical protein [Aliikangiella sp. IMCC44359]|uniref:hypothetical protein n=1 Tax=Aliikangiella sp. IMCC44359 TaxID=3459125 RepID=UPI00403ADE3C
MYSKEKYGKELAANILGYLKKHEKIDSNHYGYCGVGFVLNASGILYTHFDEWLTYQHGKEYIPGEEYLGIIKKFADEEEFINWLSEQSDYSLSGIETNDQWYIGNQRITKARLEKLLVREYA